MRSLSLWLLLPVLSLAFVWQTPAVTGRVVTSESLAREAGQSILLQGGNAIDAAVAAAFALGVVAPHRAGIGGGAILLIRPTGDAQPVVIDALETAPHMAQMRKIEGWPSVGVPGTLSGLITALDQYGTMGLSSVLSPAIQLAQRGVPVSAALHGAIEAYRSHLSQAASQVYLRRSRALQIGERLVQRDLAWTHRQIARDGVMAFYEGVLAQRTIHAAYDAWLSAQDLANYRPQMRRTIHTTYRGYDILTAPPPFTGGVQLLQCLNMLEPFDTPMLEHNSPEYVHVLAEVLRRSGFDRWQYAGDQGHVPLKQLISKEYAAIEAIPIQLDRMSRWDYVKDSPPLQQGSSSSAVVAASDAEGNMVVIAQTLHGTFGSGIMVPGTGILLNRAMADFSPPPSHTGSDSLVPELTVLNQVAPGKRPASPLLPVIVLQNGKPVMACANAGQIGSPSVALQILLNYIDFGMSIEAALATPRLQLDSEQERLFIEWGMSVNVPALVRKGHSVQRIRYIGQPQVVDATESLSPQPQNATDLEGVVSR